MCVKWLLTKSLDSAHPLQIQWYIWYDMRGLLGQSEHTWTFWAICLDTFTFWGHVHEVWWLQRYRYWDIYDTDGIWWYKWDMMIHMRYRSLGPVWIHIEALGRVLGRIVLWGLDLCMHIYDEICEIWDGISPSICCSSGAWWFPDCPSVKIRI